MRLAEKYRKGRASAEEIYFLEKYFDHFSKEPVPLDKHSASETDELKASIFRKIEFEAYGNEPVPLLRRSSFRIAAAAIFLIVCGSILLLFLKQEPSSPHLASAPAKEKKDIAPGGNKAVLTLANGSQIVLDTNKRGNLAFQGNTKIINLKDGKLKYAANGSSRKVMYNTITTPHGGQYAVILPDGTNVLLNSVSSLRFPTSFSGNSRNVELRGEGYFEVAADKKRPFTVTVNGMKVDVLGTSFNIMAYPGEGSMKTSLVNGSVRVSSGAESRIIIPGQQAELAASAEKLNIHTTDMDEVLAWKNGEFRFRETEIRTIMRQISRWYDVDIEYRGNPSGIVLSGIIPRKEYVSQLLEAFQATEKVHFEIGDKKITVIPGKGN